MRDLIDFFWEMTLWRKIPHNCKLYPLHDGMGGADCSRCKRQLWVGL